MWLSLDFDQAHATTADRFQSFIMTERGNIDTNTAARFQDRNAWLKLMNLSVNDSFRQFPNFLTLLTESLQSLSRDQHRTWRLS